MSDITVILNGYNRGYLLKQQIDSIKSQTVKSDDIMLWYNKGDNEQIKIDDPDIKCVYSNHNFKFHGRFAYALLSKTKYIAMFDDDIIPGSKWFEHCLEYMDKLDGILGATGVYLQSNNYENNTKYGYNGIKNYEVVEVDLVGHAWFFKREWLKYMWMEYPISWENGEDMQFSCFCKKYGGIKTYVPPLVRDSEKIGSKNIRYGGDEFASWRKSSHSELRNNIVKKLIDDGWKTVKMTK